MLAALPFLTLLFSPPAHAQDVNALVTEAIASNPAISRLTATEDAVRARARVAGAWSDPRVMLEASNFPVTTFNPSDHPMAGVQLRVDQRLRAPSWSGLRRGVLDAHGDAAAADTADAALRIEAMVRDTYWRLTRSRLLQGVTQEHIARTEELLQAVFARYETGSTGQHAVLRLQVLRDRLTDELADYQQDDDTLTAMLSRALSADAARTYITPDRLDVLAAPADTDWRPVATDHNPIVTRLAAERAAAETAQRLARVDALPLPTVFAGLRVRTVNTATDPGTELVSLGVSVPIPVGSGRRAGGEVAAQQSRVRALDAALASFYDDVDAQMATILARWRRAAQKADTYRTLLLPEARDSLTTTQSEYTVDRADFSSLFDAEVTLLDLDRAWITAATETHLQHAGAIAALGVDPIGAPQ